jgi:hypothetical protein
MIGCAAVLPLASAGQFSVPRRCGSGSVRCPLGVRGWKESFPLAAVAPVRSDHAGIPRPGPPWPPWPPWPPLTGVAGSNGRPDSGGALRGLIDDADPLSSASGAAKGSEEVGALGPTGRNAEGCAAWLGED